MLIFPPLSQGKLKPVDGNGKCPVIMVPFKTDTYKIHNMVFPTKSHTVFGLFTFSNLDAWYIEVWTAYFDAHKILHLDRQCWSV